MTDRRTSPPSGNIGSLVTSQAEVAAAADILWTAYGEHALDRAKLLEQRMPGSEFARRVRKELEKNPIRSTYPSRFDEERH